MMLPILKAVVKGQGHLLTLRENREILKQLVG